MSSSTSSSTTTTPSTSLVQTAVETVAGRNASNCILPQPPLSSPKSGPAPGVGSPTTGGRYQLRRPIGLACPHICLPIHSTPPPLPPPPLNPVLTPLRARSGSHNWAPKSFITDLPTSRRSSCAPITVPSSPVRKCAPPRPTTPPTILIDEPKQSAPKLPAASSPASTGVRATTTTTTSESETKERVSDSLNLPHDRPAISLSQEVYHIVVYMGHSSLLLLSYVTWIAGLIILMPALLAAYTLRQLGLLWARQHDVVRPHGVACGPPVCPAAQTLPPSFLPRLSEEKNLPPETLSLLDGVTTGTLEPLSAPSLRYLPPLPTSTCRCHSGGGASIVTSNYWSAFIVVAVYLGAPGIRLHALKRLLYNRLFTGRDKHRAHFPDGDVAGVGTETPATSSRGRLLRTERYRWFTERLQQYVVALPTGYAWQKCSVLNIDDHVVPAFLSSYSNRQARSPSRLPSPTLRSFELPNGMGDSLDSLIGQIASAHLPSGQPLWQVHLVEDFESKETAPIKRGESPFTNPLPEKDYLAPWRSCRASMLSTSSDSNDSPLHQRGASASSPSPTSSTSSSPQHSLLGRGSNLPKRMGSLVIFRVHASITDNVQSLVEFIAALLSDQEAADSAFKPSGGKLASPSSLPSNTQVNKSPEVPPTTSPAAAAASPKPQEVLAAAAAPEVLGEKVQGTALEAQTAIVQPGDSSSVESRHTTCWWHGFSLWLRQMNGLRSEVIRALTAGPFLMLYNMCLLSADMGLFPSLNRSEVGQPAAAAAASPRQQQRHRLVYRRAQFSLEKLTHIQKVTRASLSEVLLSLLAGALRAYQQTSGLLNPPDLLARSCLHLTQYAPCNAALAATGDVPPTASEPEAADYAGMERQHPPAECVFVATRLPVRTEGMLPRLWLMQQRMQLVRRTAVALTCSWMRALLYILLPHWWATRLDDVLLGCAKCSLTFVETELEQLCLGGTGGGGPARARSGRPKSGKSKRKRARMSPGEPVAAASPPGQLSPTADLQPSATATSGSPLSRAELICASPCDRRPGVIYLPDGVPIVRIDCWFFPQNPLTFDLLRGFSVGRPEPVMQNPPATAVREAVEEQEFCRSLTLSSCTYAGQLTVGFTGCEHIDGQPGMGLIIEAMENQLNQLYKLLDNRFPAKSVAYPPTRYFNFDFTNKVSHHTSPEGRKGSPSTPHDVFVRHSPNYDSAPMTPVADAVNSQISATGGEIVDGDGSRTLKYNLPSLSSGPRRSSFRRAAYRPKQPIDVEQPQSCTDTVTLNPSNIPLNKKLVPILKKSSSYCSNKENENIRMDSDTLAPQRKPPSRLKRDQRDGGSNDQHTITSSLVKQFRKLKTPPAPPLPRRPQVRFVTDD